MKTEKLVYTRYEFANSPGFALCEHVTLTGLLRSCQDRGGLYEGETGSQRQQLWTTTRQ
jgi:hypothetical protein